MVILADENMDDPHGPSRPAKADTNATTPIPTPSFFRRLRRIANSSPAAPPCAEASPLATKFPAASQTNDREDSCRALQVPKTGISAAAWGSATDAAGKGKLDQATPLKQHVAPPAAAPGCMAAFFWWLRKSSVKHQEKEETVDVQRTESQVPLSTERSVAAAASSGSNWDSLGRRESSSSSSNDLARFPSWIGAKQVGRSFYWTARLHDANNEPERFKKAPQPRPLKLHSRAGLRRAETQAAAALDASSSIRAAKSAATTARTRAAAALATKQPSAATLKMRARKAAAAAGATGGPCC